MSDRPKRYVVTAVMADDSMVRAVHEHAFACGYRSTSEWAKMVLLGQIRADEHRNGGLVPFEHEYTTIGSAPKNKAGPKPGLAMARQIMREREAAVSIAADAEEGSVEEPAAEQGNGPMMSWPFPSENWLGEQNADRLRIAAENWNVRAEKKYGSDWHTKHFVPWFYKVLDDGRDTEAVRALCRGDISAPVPPGKDPVT